MSRVAEKIPPTLSFRARIFVALVGISSVTSLIIGLVLYYFAQDRLVHEENTLLKQRSQTANAGAQDFLEGLRDPEDGTLPPPSIYADQLVQSVADPTGLEVLYLGPHLEPLAAADGLGRHRQGGPRLRRSPRRARGHAHLPALRHTRGHTHEHHSGRGGEHTPHAPGHAAALRDPRRGHKGRLRGLRGHRADQKQGRARRGGPHVQL